jgi:hypothetical protein
MSRKEERERAGQPDVRRCGFARNAVPAGVSGHRGGVRGSGRLGRLRVLGADRQEQIWVLRKRPRCARRYGDLLGVGSRPGGRPGSVSPDAQVGGKHAAL